MFTIIQVIVFVIVCVCLPELMLLALVGLIGFIVCKVTNRRSIGQMILLLVVFLGLDIVVSKVQEIIDFGKFIN